MIIYTRSAGFTLIELLVVMVILGLSSSLVAPDMFSIVKRAQAKTELEKIKAITELSVERSFFSASTIDIIFKDNTVVFSQVNPLAIEEISVLREIKSEFFVFEETHVVINNGIWIGSSNVKLVKSPENKLTTFALFEDNEQIKTIDSEYSEAEGNTL